MTVSDTRGPRSRRFAGGRPWSRRRLVKDVRSWSGQGLVEYGLILTLIAIVTVIALIFLGGQLAVILSVIGSSIDGST